MTEPERGYRTPPRPQVHRPAFYPRPVTLDDFEDPDGVAALASVRRDEIRTLAYVRAERFPRALRGYKGKRRAS